jgi:hypothetical protein
MRFFTYQIGVSAPDLKVVGLMVRHNPFKRHIEQLRAFFNQYAVCGDCRGYSGNHQFRNLRFNVRTQ